MECKVTGLGRSVKNVAQFCQAAMPCGTYPVQGFEHQAVGGFVQVELRTDAVVSSQMRKGFRVRQGYHHRIAVYEAYGAGKVEIMQSTAVVALS